MTTLTDYLSTLAPTASPTFTGSPRAPTPANADSSTAVATTAWVKAQGYGSASYTLPAATTTTLGGTIIGTGLAVSNGTISVAYGTAANTAAAGNDSRITGALSAAAAAATYQPIGSYLTSASLTSNVTGILPVANGGTGTATPGLVAGTNVTLTGAWPNQTVAAAVPAASSTTPLVDGTAAVGVGNTFARADHVHPTDASRAPLASPTLTGTVTVNAPSGRSVGGEITLQASTASPSARAQLTMGGWQWLQDTNMSGVKDYALYQGATGLLPLRFDEKGRPYLIWEYNALSPDPNSYAKVGFGLYAAATLGNRAASTGTLTTTDVSCGIGEIADRGNGTLSEFASNYEITYAYRNKTQKAWNIWGRDAIVVDRPAGGGAEAPKVFVGSSLRLHSSNDMRPVVSNSLGSFGFSIVTRPLETDEFNETGSRNSDRTYPVRAMLSIVGFSGANAAGVISGLSSGADDAADYGILIGGSGGSPYLAYDARSRFRVGAAIADWRETGLYIAAPLSGFNGRPLTIAAGGGPAAIGDIASSPSNATVIIGQRAAGQAPLSLVGMLSASNTNLRDGDLYIDAANNVKWIPAGGTPSGTSPVYDVSTKAPITNPVFGGSVVTQATGTDVKLEVQGDAGQSRYLRISSLVSGVAKTRWDVVVDNSSETGSNAGSDFYLNSSDDSGTFLRTPLSISRATGKAAFTTPPDLGASPSGASSDNTAATTAWVAGKGYLTSAVTSLGGTTGAITLGTGLSIASGVLSSSGSMVYPGAGIPNSTGSAWGTSYSTTGSGTALALAASPALTGTPTAPTAAATDNSTTIATTAHVFSRYQSIEYSAGTGNGTGSGGIPIPAWAKAGLIEVSGGGGSGGSGAHANTATAATGGGGGGGGYTATRTYPADQLRSAFPAGTYTTGIPYTVGSGGAAVNGSATVNTAGTNGNAGSASYFGSTTSTGALLSAGGGGGGIGGLVSATSAAGGGSGSAIASATTSAGASGGGIAGGSNNPGAVPVAPGFGASGGGSSSIGVGGAAGGNTSPTGGGAGGGAGAGVIAAGTASVGGAGGGVLAAGPSGGLAGTAATPATPTAGATTTWGPGQGGAGGGSASGTGSWGGGAGSAGAFPGGGGGGGGACVSTLTGAAGPSGRGGDGRIRVTWWG